MVCDDTVEHEPLFAVFTQEKKDLDGNTNGYSITVYMPQRIVEYRTKMSMEVSAMIRLFMMARTYLEQSQ